MFKVEVVKVEISVLGFNDNTSNSLIEVSSTLLLLIELDEHIESFTKSGESEISVQILISSFDLNLFNLKSLDFFKCEITNEPIINLLAIDKSCVSLVREFSSVGNIGDTRESGIMRNEKDVILGNLNI